jgi:hypothetical protein
MQMDGLSAMPHNNAVVQHCYVLNNVTNLHLSPVLDMERDSRQSIVGASVVLCERSRKIDMHVFLESFDCKDVCSCYKLFVR